MSYYDPLIGQTIREIYREGDGLVLKTDEWVFGLEPFGDCCSTTWIESIDLVEPLYGTVQKVEDIDMPHRGNIATVNFTRVEEVAYYGLRITTDRGVSVIDYRNSSNGYYGGCLHLTMKRREVNPRQVEIG